MIVDGRVRRGTIRRRAQLAALGLGQRLALVVAELERGRHKVEQAEAGQFTGLRLIRLGGPLGPDELRTGQALVKPETPEVRRFTAHLDLLALSEGGRVSPVRSGHVGLLLFGTLVVAGQIEVLGQETIAPGEGATVAVTPLQPVYVEPGMTFLLRDGNQGVWSKGQPARWAGTAGMGRVLEARGGVTS